MAVVALIFRDPLVLEMARCQGATIGVTQVVDHGQHHMAARARANFVHSFERMVVGDEDCARGHYDERCEGRQLGGRFSWQSRDPKGGGPSITELAEPRMSGANAKQDAQHAEKRTEEINKLDIAQVHVATFRTETAVTLNSGSLE